VLSLPVILVGNTRNYPAVLGERPAIVVDAGCREQVPESASEPVLVRNADLLRDLDSVMGRIAASASPVVFHFPWFPWPPKFHRPIPVVRSERLPWGKLFEASGLPVGDPRIVFCQGDPETAIDLDESLCRASAEAILSGRNTSGRFLAGMTSGWSSIRPLWRRCLVAGFEGTFGRVRGSHSPWDGWTDAYSAYLLSGSF
jgi:hypothetical protein